MSTPESRNLIRSAIITLVRAEGGEMVTRDLAAAGPETFTVTEPESLAAVRAAQRLAFAAEHAIRRYAHDAREDGHGWDEIGTALGCRPDPDRGITAAGAAFRLVAPDLGSGPCFGWTCPACRKTVLDHGPEMGHPVDQERGHGEGCARLAEAVRAYDAQWEDGSDEH